MADIKISTIATAATVFDPDELHELAVGGVSKSIKGELMHEFRKVSKNANATLALSDRLKHVVHDSGTATPAYTIPTNASVAFMVGTRIRFTNLLASYIATIVPDAGVTLLHEFGSGTYALTYGCTVELVKIDTNTWLVLGTCPNYGVFTPAGANVANCTSVSTFQCQWTRDGNIIDMNGTVAIVPASAGATTQASLTVPIASALNDTINDASGVAVSPGATQYVGFLRADGAGKLLFQFTSGGTSNVSFRFNAKYLIHS